MFLIFIIYFFAGVLQDFLFTMNLRYIAKDKTSLSVLTSFFAVFVSMFVLYNIITELNPSSGIVAIIVYCFGIAFGTFLAMKIKIGLKD